MIKYSSLLNTLLLNSVTPDICFGTFNRGRKENAKKQKEAENMVFGHCRPQPGSDSRRSITSVGSYRHSPRKPVPCCSPLYEARCCYRGYLAHFGTDSAIGVHRQYGHPLVMLHHREQDTKKIWLTQKVAIWGWRIFPIKQHILQKQAGKMLWQLSRGQQTGWVHYAHCASALWIECLVGLVPAP